MCWNTFCAAVDCDGIHHTLDTGEHFTSRRMRRTSIKGATIGDEPCPHCEGTGLRMDIGGQLVRIEDPDYTCNGCKGTGWPIYYPILRAE